MKVSEIKEKYLGDVSLRELERSTFSGKGMKARKELFNKVNTPEANKKVDERWRNSLLGRDDTFWYLNSMNSYFKAIENYRPSDHSGKGARKDIDALYKNIRKLLQEAVKKTEYALKTHEQLSGRK